MSSEPVEQPELIYQGSSKSENEKPENIFAKSAEYRVLKRALDAGKLPKESDIQRYLTTHALEALPTRLDDQINRLTQKLELQAQRKREQEHWKSKREYLRSIQEDHEQNFEDKTISKFFEEGAHAAALSNMLLKQLSWATALLARHGADLPDVDRFLLLQSVQNLDNMLKPSRLFFFGDENATDINLIRDIDIDEEQIRPYQINYREDSKPAPQVNLLDIKFQHLTLHALDSTAREKLKLAPLEIVPPSAMQSALQSAASAPDMSMHQSDLDKAAADSQKLKEWNDRLIRVLAHNPWDWQGGNENKDASLDFRPATFIQMCHDQGISYAGDSGDGKGSSKRGHSPEKDGYPDKRMNNQPGSSPWPFGNQIYSGNSNNQGANPPEVARLPWDGGYPERPDDMRFSSSQHRRLQPQFHQSRPNSSNSQQPNFYAPQPSHSPMPSSWQMNPTTTVYPGVTREQNYTEKPNYIHDFQAYPPPPQMQYGAAFGMRHGNAPMQQQTSYPPQQAGHLQHHPPYPQQQASYMQQQAGYPQQQESYPQHDLRRQTSNANLRSHMDIHGPDSSRSAPVQEGPYDHNHARDFNYNYQNQSGSGAGGFYQG